MQYLHHFMRLTNPCRHCEHSRTGTVHAQAPLATWAASHEAEPELKREPKPVPNPHHGEVDCVTRRALLAAGGAYAVALGVAALGWPRPGQSQTHSAEATGHLQPSVIRVLAASDLKFALGDIAADFERLTGHTVQVTYGSSGNLARQIQQGLPADLFFSADEAFVLALADAGLTWRSANPAAASSAQGLNYAPSAPDRGVRYAQGRIALIVPQASTVALDASLAGVKAQWAAIQKIAIANPEHAPYGRAAKEALQALDWWPQAQAKLVLGENIAQATQFVTTGAAQVGITALSLALAPQVATQVRHIMLPETLHAPLLQRMVRLRSANDASLRFFETLQSPTAKAVLRRYGFVP